MNYKIKNFIINTCLKIVVWLQSDSNSISHTKREVPEWFNEEGPNRWMANGTIELLAVLSHQGHSGGSIGFALDFFKAMALQEPWGPLTGEDSEWMDVSDASGEVMFQNIRCSHVFKNDDGAYNLDGKVFHDGDDSYYTNGDSRVPVEFPYTVPKPIVVDTTA